MITFQIFSETKDDALEGKAASAANKYSMTGELPKPPEGISPVRWKAMLDSIIKNGLPK